MYKDLNHERIQEIRITSEVTHAWDFAICEGDSIKEKYENLYYIISTLCCAKQSTETQVIGHPVIVSALIVVMDLDPAFKESGDGVIYVGEVKKEHPNGRWSNFGLYQDENFAKDEVLMCVGHNVKVLKIFNYPL